MDLAGTSSGTCAWELSPTVSDDSSWNVCKFLICSLLKPNESKMHDGANLQLLKARKAQSEPWHTKSHQPNSSHTSFYLSSVSNQRFEAVLGVQIPPFHQCVFGTGTKSHTWGKTPELTIFPSGRNIKKPKICHNVSQSSYSNIEFCKPDKKGTAMLQKDICQVTEVDLQIFQTALQKGYHLFHLKKNQTKIKLF